MFFFKCVLTEDEFSALRVTISSDEYCLVRLPGDKNSYAIIAARLRDNIMDVLSGETLEQLEYLDEEEMRDVIKAASNYEVVGNRELLKRLL